MKNLPVKLIFFGVIVLSFAVAIFAQDGELEKGIALYEKGDYANAVKTLKNAAKRSSSDAQIWYYLGLSYAKNDKKKEAEKALEKAVALDGANADYHVGLGYVYLIRNDLPKARTEAQAAIAITPKIAEAHYIFGVVNYREGMFDIAYERAKKAIELSPNLAPAYLLKSESLVSSFAIQTGTVIKPKSTRKELLNEAVQDLEKYLSLSPVNDDTNFQREYLESLKFFAGYYSKPENQMPVGFDISAQPDTTRTGIRILAKPRAVYTDAARQAFIRGTIRLLVGFSENGTIEHILVIKSLGYGLNERAVRAARGIKFVPATQDGKPVSVVKMVEYTFSIY